jgi:hypothetical protein
MLTVNGSGFASGAVVNWNGSSRITFVNSSHQVQADIKASDVAKASTASVTVVNPGPGGGTSNVLYLPIRKPSRSVGFGRDAKVTPQGGAATAGDFNGDGIVDFAVATPSTLFVYLGKGDGSFRRPIQTTLSFYASFVSAADINNDGKLDLLMVGGSNSTSEVDILLGDGTGHFSLSQTIPFGSAYFPVATAVGDLNGDGKLDFVVTAFARGSGVIFVYLGNGDGTFTQGSSLGDLGSGSFPALADFNGDGNLDIATAIAFGPPAVAIYLGKGDGTFVDGGVYSTKNFAGAVAAADVNGDGKLDLITNGVDVLLGNGDGTFSQGVSVPVPTDDDAPVVVGDFNGDGNLDVGLVPISCQQSCQEKQITVLLGDGKGGFQSPLQFAISISGLVGFSAADFNNDGRLDFVVGGDTSGAEVLLQGTAIVDPMNLDFGTIKVGSHSQPQTTKLTNIGGTPLKIDSISIGGDPTDFSETNHCGNNLPPHGSCNIKVTFSPTKAGMLLASLEIKYSGGNVLDVALTGTGIQSTVSLTPSQMTFALQLVGTTSSAQTATLTNTGSQTVNISNIQATAPFGESNNCPAALPPNNSCQIQVTFQPTQRGDVKGTLEVTDDAQGSPQKVALSGSGTVVKLSTTSVNFGDQKVGTKSPAVPIKLTNVGTVALSISQIALVGNDPGDFSETNNCGTSVPPGGNCTIKVRFEPQKKGQRSADLSITDDGGGSPQQVGLFGNGT